MKVWDEKTTALVQAATGGLKKQLDIQRQWYSDPKSGEAECALRQRLHIQDHVLMLTAIG